MIQFPKLDIADEQREAFIQAVKKGHPLAAPTACPPPTVSAKGLRDLVDGSGFLARSLFSLTDRLFGGDPIEQADELGLPSDLKQCLKDWNRPEFFDQAKWYFRPDLLLTDDGFKAVEINVGASLGGPGVCDVHAQTYYDWFGSTDPGDGLQREALGANWVAGLLAKLRTHQGLLPERPTFCSITPNDSVDLRDDFSLNDLQTLMNWHGINYIFASAEDLKITRDGVWLDDQKIDIVFTDFCYSKFIHAGGDFEIISRLIDSHVNKGVLFLSPPHNTIYDQKSLFVYMTDPTYQHHFTPQDWARLNRHLPSTRILDNALRATLKAEKADWVIKPKYNYGGQGVGLGVEQTQNDWDSAVDRAIDGPHVFVAQKVVTNQLRIYDQNLGHERQCCFGPLFNFGSYIGSFYRDVQLGGDRPLVINTVAGARYASIRVANDQ